MPTRPIVVLPGLVPGLAGARTHEHLVEAAVAGAVLDTAQVLGELPATPTLDDLADVIGTALDRTGLEDVALLAEGFTATAALRVAALRPERIGELVLVAPLGFVSPLTGQGRGRPFFAEAVCSLFSGDADRAQSGLGALGVAEDGVLDRAAQGREFAAATDCRVRAAGEVVAAMVEAGEFDRVSHPDGLREVRKPVNLIWGRDDVCAPLDSAFYLERRLRDAQLRVVPNIGHLVTLQWGAELTRFVLTALALSPSPAVDPPLVDSKGA